MNIEEFTSGLAEKGISLSPRQLEQFELYYDMLVEWNEKINLTSITEKKEVYLKHFYDSITAAFYVDFNQVNTICDVGRSHYQYLLRSRHACLLSDGRDRRRPGYHCDRIGYYFCFNGDCGLCCCSSKTVKRSD